VKRVLELIFGGIVLAGALSGCHRPDWIGPRADISRPVTASPRADAPLPDLGQPSTRGTGGAATFAVPPEPGLPFRRDEVAIEAAHVYTLPELIDLAQRSNPTTRIAWEQARQAALAVGLVEATYLPDLSAEVLGGAQRTPLPVPKLLDAKGNLVGETAEVVPSLVVKWLLFDFGQRDALADAARQTAKAADVGFTGAHQKLIFDVSKAYFALDAERSQLQVAESALKSARILQDAAEARNSRGLATVTEVATTQRGTAKALYDVEQAKAIDNDAYHALVEAMGLTQTQRLTIASSAGRALPDHLADDADSAIQRALTRRPDIVAALAKLRASEAGVAAAESSYYPKIGLEGTAGQNIGALKINGRPSTSVNEPTAGIVLKLSLPLYDGGLREKTESIARSQRIAAEEELSKAQDEAVRQVAHAHDTLKSALAQYDAARAFVAAADKEADSALEAYRNGVGTLIVAATADTNRTEAQSAQARAYAGVLTAAAALAFTTGELTSSDVLEHQP
jgi:outer membrane protein TolC